MLSASLAALEAAGLLGVANRLLRVRWKDEAAFAWRIRVMRTSNCYWCFTYRLRKISIIAGLEGALAGNIGNRFG